MNLPDAPPKEDDRIYSENYACPEHGGSFEEPAPRNFSFNSPHGACPDCTGLGSRLEIDPDLVLPNDELSVDEGAILPVAPHGRHGELVRQDPRRRGRALPLPHRRPGARPVRRGAPDPPVREPGPARRREVSGAQRQHPHLQDDLRGRRPEPDPALPGDGLRGDAGRARALHDEQALPDLQRHAPQAGVAGRHDRRPQHHRDDAALGDRCAGVVRPPPEAPERAREPDRGPGPQGDPRAARLPGRRRARLPDARPRVRHAVRRRGAAHPAGDADRLEPDGRALHPRRAIDRPPPARQRAAHRDARPAARPGQHAARRRARRGDDPLGRLGHRHRPGGGRARRPAHPLGAAARAAREPSVDHGGLPARRQGGARAGAASQRQGRGDRRPRRAREQPQGDRRRVPAGAVRGRHRRERVRQVEPRDADPPPGAGAAHLGLARAGRQARPDRGDRPHRQGHRDRPVADRPHAALEPGDLHRPVDAAPRAARRRARGAAARLQAGALQLQRQGRPLRGVRGRRHRPDRDALPARRVRGLRGVQGASATTARRSRSTTRARTSPRSWR